MPEGTKYTDDNIQKLMDGFDFHYQNTNVPYERKFFLPKKVREKIYKTIPPSDYPEDQMKRSVKNLAKGKTRMDTMSDIDNLIRERKDYSDLEKQYEEEMMKTWYMDTSYYKDASRQLAKYNTGLVNKLDSLDEARMKISEGYDTHDEDMWKFYLGLDQSDNTVRVSKYKPTKSDNPKTTYYTLKDVVDDDLDWKEDIWVQIQAHEDKGGKFPTKEIGGVTGMANIKVDKGEDEEGKYYSIYDKYDFDISGEGLVGQPYEIYDRIYYDDSGEITNKKK